MNIVYNSYSILDNIFYYILFQSSSTTQLFLLNIYFLRTKTDWNKLCDRISPAVHLVRSSLYSVFPFAVARGERICINMKRSNEPSKITRTTNEQKYNLMWTNRTRTDVNEWTRAVHDSTKFSAFFATIITIIIITTKNFFITISITVDSPFLYSNVTSCLPALFHYCCDK